jgi:hypothetical protein
MVYSFSFVRAAVRFAHPISAGPITPFERAACEAALLIGVQAPFKINAFLVR